MKGLAILVAVWLAIAVKAPAPQAGDKDEHSKQTSGLKSHPEAAEQPANPTVRIENSVNCSPCKPGGKEQTKRNANKPHDIIDWLNAFSTLIIAVFTVILCGIVYLQLRASHNTERAWILVEIGDLPDFRPDPNKAEFLWIFPTIKNFGKTPARIKRIRAVVRLVQDGQRLPEVPQYPIGQGADVNANVVLPPNIPIQPIKLGVTGDEFRQIQEGKLFLYVHGFINYVDAYRNRQMTAFCFYYAIQAGFSPAPTRFYLELTAPPAYNEVT